MTLRDLLSGLGNKLSRGVATVNRVSNPIGTLVANKAAQAGQYTRNNPKEAVKKALEFGAGFQGGFVKAVPGEFTEKFLNKLDIPVYNVPTKTGQMGNITGNIASTAVQGMGLGKVMSPSFSGVQKILGHGAGQLIAKGGKAKLFGQGVANLSKGLPYSASYPVLNQLSDNKPNATKDVGGNLAFDAVTGSLPFLGLGGMVVGKNAKNFKNLAKVSGAFDNLPRAEISDLSSRVKGNFIDIIQGLVKKGETPVLADVMGHDSLYKSYPQLKLLKIELDPSYVAKGNRGSYNPVTNIIKVNPTLPRGQFRSTLLHEVQHAVQEIEGFAKGADPREISKTIKLYEKDIENINLQLNNANRNGNKSLYNELLDKRQGIVEQILKLQDEFGSPMGGYLKNAAELEARSTQLREGMTSAQRKAINPYEQILNKEGIKRSDVIVNKGGGESLSVSDDLVKEARKYKSAEEFINSKINAYHGSPNHFDKFSYENMGKQGTSEGFGFYFTDKKNIAQGYTKGPGGMLKEAFVRIDKPLSNWKQEITAPQLEKFIRKLDPNGQGYLSNWGDVSYEGYNNVLKKAVKAELEGSSNSVDLISGIINADGRDMVGAYKALKDTLGYDGILETNPAWGKGQTIRIAFDNNQIIDKTQLKAIWNRANKSGEMLSVGKAKLNDGLDALKNEARKYKSAEEFVKGQGETVYRGGKPLDISKINDEGLPVTFDNKVAEQFARSKNQFAESPAGQIMGYQKGQNIVESYQLSPNAKIAIHSDIPETIFSAYKQANPLTKPDVAEPIVVKWAKENGYDAIDFRTLGKTSAKEAEIKILNPNILKTKSQLTDIWNKANKGGESLLSDGVKYGEYDKLTKSLERTQFKNISQSEKEALLEEAQKMVAGGIGDVGVIKNEGDVVGRYSANPSWYKDFFKSNGRAPTNEEFFGLAYQRIKPVPIVPDGMDLDQAVEFQNINPMGVEKAQKKLKDLMTYTDRLVKEKGLTPQQAQKIGYKKGMVILEGQEGVPQLKKQTPLQNQVGGKDFSSTSQPQVLKQAGEVPQKPISPQSKVEQIVPTTSQKIETGQQVNKGADKTYQIDPSLERIVRQSTNVKNKVGVLDYLRTPDRVLKKIGLESSAKELRKAGEKYTKELPEEINKITQWYKQAPSPESATKIFKRLDGQYADLNPAEVKIADEIKDYLSQWADRLELPKDKRITNYITHIFDDQLVKKEFDEDLAKLIQDNVAGSVYDPFTQQRLGKMGYKENVWDALDAYVKRAVRKVNMDPALEQVKNASEHLETSQFDYVKELVDRINMRPTKIDNLIDNTIKQVFGYKFSARPTAYLSRKSRQWVYRGTLGLNVGSALRNLTQGVNTYAKLGEKYTVLGYTKLLTNGKNGIDELKRVGVLADDIIQDRSINVSKKSLEKMDKGLFYMFELAEKINRGSAYFGAKAKALSKGVPEEQAVEYAKKIVRDTQFTFGKVDTPVALQSDIAKTVAQFQTYNLKQAEFLTEMIKNKEYAGIARYAVGSIVAVATIGELLGLDLKDMLPSFSFRGGLPPVLSIPVEAGKPWVTGKDKYGNELNTKEKIDSTVKSLTPLVPGGVQIKKTIEGLTDVSKGYSESASGRVKYPVKQSTGNYIRGGLFGRWNLPEAQEYLKEKRSVLGENQSKLFKQSQDKEGLYNSMIESRQAKAEETRLKDVVKKSGQPQATEESIMYLDGDSVKTVKKNITFPKLTSSNELNKKLISGYKGDVTDYANYVMYMYKSGKMTAEQAGAVLERLRKMTDLATKSTKVSKPKTTNTAKLARQILKPAKVQTSSSNSKLNTFSILDDYAKMKAKTPVFKLPVLKKGER